MPHFCMDELQAILFVLSNFSPTHLYAAFARIWSNQ